MPHGSAMPAELLPPLWISQADVEALLEPAALIAAIEEGFCAVEAGQFNERPSTRMDGMDGGDAYMTLYPSQASGSFASVKLLAGRPSNAREGRPEIDAVVALVDPSTGRIVALIAARALTALRTAAATTAVLKRLIGNTGARIGLIGTGSQIMAHGRMLAAVGLARDFAVASPSGSLTRASSVATEIAARTGIKTRPCACNDIARDSDVLILATLASQPVDVGDIGENCVIASIGPFYPHAHELAPGLLMHAAFIVSDDPERLRRQWASAPQVEVDAWRVTSVAALVSDKVIPPATGRRIFLSDGRAFQDNIAAVQVYRAALVAGRGMRLP
jgi:ornithine cyclodeaminase/alanine dehydrogenase-like protein (mu-crystallin family)